MRTFTLLVLSALAALAQYKAEATGAPPAALDAAVIAQLQKTGTKVMGPDGSVFCEIWFRDSIPPAVNSEESVTFTNIGQGTLLGAIQFPKTGADRRGQTLKPGVYTLRYSMYPINGDHQGAAPQRDFAVMTPAGDDKNPTALPDFKTLVEWSKKASNTPHPAVLSIWKQDSDFKPGLSQLGEHDWVLQVKLGDKPLAIILVGKTEA